MRLDDVTTSNLNEDYWFLRRGRVQATTAMQMIGLAYRSKEVIIKLPEEGKQR